MARGWLWFLGGLVGVGTPGVLAINLNHPGHYIHWGVLQISVANLVVIAVMLALFVAALLLPFPGRRRDR